MVRRHFHLLVPAPGREAEGVEALSSWLDEVEGAPGYLGGAVYRDYARELHDLNDLLGFTYDLESREIAKDFRKATENVSNPLSSDGEEGTTPPDQPDVLLGGKSTETEQEAPGIELNLGGGLFGRILHIHFEVLKETGAIRSAAGGV